MSITPIQATPARQYKGMRYVPIFDGDWDNTKDYEPLVIVSYQGNSYTSRTFVPAGTAITNETYWALTGNYNAQVEAYRQEVATLSQLIMDGFVTPEMFGAVGDGVTDDTTAIKNAISSNHNCIVFDSKKYKISSAITDINKKYIIGYNTEIYLESSNDSNYHFKADNLDGVLFDGIKFTSNKTKVDTKLYIAFYSQYSKNCTFRNCAFENLSAGIGFFDSNHITITDCIFENMYQFADDAPLYPNVYGYGVVLNACDGSVITGNVFGTTDKPVERHGVYISRSRASAGSINTLNKVIIDGNIFNQIIYNSETTPVSNREYCVKVIDGNDVLISNNIASGGVGFLQVAFDVYEGGNKISVSNNEYEKGKIFIASLADNLSNVLNTLYVNGNHAKLSTAQSTSLCAILSNNIKNIFSSDNIFEVVDGISTVASFVEGNEYLTNENYQYCETFKSTNDLIKNFESVCSLYHVNDVDYDSTYIIDDTAQIGAALFSLSSGNTQRINYKDGSTYFNFKASPSLVINNTIYRDSVMGVVKITKSGSTVILYDDAGITVGSATRPDDYPPIKAFYDYTNNVVIYKTQFGWNTINTRYKDSYTKADLLALTPPGYSRIPLYCNETKKPYWYDAYSHKWKDAEGVELT